MKRMRPKETFAGYECWERASGSFLQIRLAIVGLYAGPAGVQTWGQENEDSPVNGSQVIETRELPTKSLDQDMPEGYSSLVLPS